MRTGPDRLVWAGSARRGPVLSVGARIHHNRAMRLLARRLVAVVSPFLLVLATMSPASASNAAGYYDGLIDYSTITNCVSIIQGSPYVEKGAGAYSGVYHDPDAGFPAVNQTTYVHLVIYGLGNACSGQYFVPSIGWDAAGIQFDQTQPIYCFNTDGQVTGADCPQWGNSLVQPGAGPGGTLKYYANNPTKGYMWPLPQGKAWEFQFPVKATSAQTNATIHSFFEMADGNDNVTLSPTASLYTFGAGTPTSVQYSSPSTLPMALAPDGVTVPKYGVISRAHVNTQGQTGTLKMQRGTKSGTFTDTVNLTWNTSAYSVDFWTDWDEAGFAALKPGSKYFWRAGFDPGSPGGGDTVWGAQQTFTMPAATTCLGRPVTVAMSLGQAPTDGDDVILGTDGVDKINAGGGNDVICGLGGADIIDGGLADDIVDAGGGNDLVYGVDGDDALKGGAGADTVSFAGATTGVVVKLGQSTEQDTHQGLDIVTGFENVTGSNKADALTGSAGANSLSGLGGKDVLKAGGGKDTLSGGKGSDTCDGGAGKDKATTCEKLTHIP